jgi:PIN domain nuclease of toxin-antitoxin system
LEIAARFPHSHSPATTPSLSAQNQNKNERRPGSRASLLLQAHCWIRKCSLAEALEQIIRSPWSLLPVLPEHLSVLAALPLLHKDPIDRMLIAQAQYENLTIITPDHRIQEYDVKTLW